MAKIDLIVQALSDKTHEDALKSTLNLRPIDKILMSVAFVRTAGLVLFKNELIKNAAEAQVFLGIRNDITSYQAVCQLLEWGVEVYAVDTGARHVIFHPKLYLAGNAINATLILGSANLTAGGMQRNIEASCVVDLTLADEDDRKMFNEVADLFSNLPIRFPRHVFKVNDLAHAQEIFKSGRLVDESIRITRPPIGHADENENRDDLGLMPLLKPKKTAKKAKSAVAAAADLDEFVEVWQSKPLKKTNLNIPDRRNTNTNANGVMGLGQGLMTGIDWHIYFYDEVFGSLTWGPGPTEVHLYRAKTSCKLVVKGVDCGDFDVDLTHDTRDETATAKEGNWRTRMHWGEMKPWIAREDLLGRTLTLSRRDSIPPQYLIEID